jgi:rubrerythrin
MRIRVYSLTVQCKESREFITFSPQISFFHGALSAGKSSIVRMIDFCLGGSLEITPAVKKEVLSVAIDVQLGDRRCNLERESLYAQDVHVIWTDEAGEHHLQVPIDPSTNPVYGDDVFNVSDLIFAFCGIRPLKVRKNKTESDAPLIRLSFRDLMWYCYLDQNELDNAFFHLQRPILEGKSRDVMRFVVGYYTERLQQLEIEHEALLAKRAGNISAIAEMRSVLDRLGYANEQRIRDEKGATENELVAAERKRAALSQAFHATTHFADALRQRLRVLSDKLGKEEAALASLEQRRSDQTALKAELTTARIKLTRMATASSVLQKVQFTSCPLCGTDVALSNVPEECPLCKSVPHRSTPVEETERIEQGKRDLEGRISELDDSLHRSENAVRKQSFEVSTLRASKTQLDQQLVVELREYDSAYVAETRELDRQVATLKERVSNLTRMAQLPEAIDRLSEEVDKSKATEQRIRRQMDDERAGLTTAGDVIRDIEVAYHDALRKVGVPGVWPTDTVRINTRNWIPYILERGDEELPWSFFNAGSGGKKTLLTVCYALAIHQVAAKRKLPLPSFLIIDTPMKNISEDVNRDIFEALYRYLYTLVQGDLAATQIIIIDKEYIEPPEGIDLTERLMMPDDPNNPPLIGYYRGA